MATWTQAQRDALAAVIATGALSITFADRGITYQGSEQLRALLAEMDHQLQAAPTHRLAATSKGA